MIIQRDFTKPTMVFILLATFLLANKNGLEYLL